MAEQEEDYSSSDDSDYVPEGASDSGSEEKDDAENDDGKQSKGKSLKKKNGLGKRKREGGIKLEGEEVEAAAEDADEERRELEEEKRALEEERKKAEAAEKERKAKEKADDIWASFLGDVGPRPKVGPSKAAETKSAKAAEEKKGPTQEPAKPGESGDAAKPGESGDSASKEKTITVTKVYDFAGEEVKVTESVKAGSKEAKQLTEKSEPTTTKPGLAQLPLGKRKPGGLGSVLGKMNKKPKMSVLDKSKMDWEGFKRNEGIEEDLKIHNKGKDGFLAKQDFLKETDLRQYEIERKLRMGQGGR